MKETFFGNESFTKLASLLTVAVAIMLTLNKITPRILCAV
jgi:hypothetical protein